MASKDKLNYLTQAVEAKIATIKWRADMLAAGTPASDRMADLLRELSSTLTDFDTRSVDVLNEAASYRG